MIIPPSWYAWLAWRHLQSLVVCGLHRAYRRSGDSPVFDPGWLRPHVSNPPYPPYHRGPYLEHYFQEYYGVHHREFDATGRYYLPISWMDIYSAGRDRFPVQRYLNLLDRSQRYFTVSQHDDAPVETFPADTTVFNAGGRRAGVPIPLISSPIPEPGRYARPERRQLCSFVGSLTHPVRRQLFERYRDRPGFLFLCREKWAIDVNADQMQEFLLSAGDSVFTLCPRGFGRTSYRLYEAMQLGSIPVYVYDDYPWLPWSDRLDWSRLCVLVPAARIPELETILRSYTRERIAGMLAYTEQVYPGHFTMAGCCVQILETLRAPSPPPG